MNTLFAYYEREEYLNTLGAPVVSVRSLQMSDK